MCGLWKLHHVMFIYGLWIAMLSHIEGEKQIRRGYVFDPDNTSDYSNTALAISYAPIS